MATKEHISAAHQIVCEGPDDIALFCRLIRDRHINDIEAGCGRNTDGEDNRCLGTGGFSRRITALKGLPAPLIQIRGIVIATDGDDDAASAFTNACRSFADAALPIPARPFEIAQVPGQIKTAVIVLPGTGRQGGLETLLLECSGYSTHPMHGCVETFHRCANSAAWPEKKLHKVQLRSLIAATFPDDPSMGISFWLADKNRPFPMTHPSLDPIAAFLIDFVEA